MEHLHQSCSSLQPLLPLLAVSQRQEVAFQPLLPLLAALVFLFFVCCCLSLVINSTMFSILYCEITFFTKTSSLSYKLPKEVRLFPMRVPICAYLLIINSPFII